MRGQGRRASQLLPTIHTSHTATPHLLHLTGSLGLWAARLLVCPSILLLHFSHISRSWTTPSCPARLQRSTTTSSGPPPPQQGLLLGHPCLPGGQLHLSLLLPPPLPPLEMTGQRCLPLRRLGCTASCALSGRTPDHSILSDEPFPPPPPLPQLTLLVGPNPFLPPSSLGLSSALST